MTQLRVVRVLGMVTVQDQGRRGWMHAAVPPGGALVRRKLRDANREVGAADGAAGIEVCGVLRVRMEGGVRDGEEIEIASGVERVVYFAVRGGLDTPIVMGSRSQTRVLRAGEVLPIGTAYRDRDRDRDTDRDSDRDDGGGPIRVVLGPDDDAFATTALAALLRVSYRIRPDSDRVGMRLAGETLLRVEGHVEAPRPLVRGAIEVPSDGLPIVLGPEHPTTGGYPVIAVVADADLDRLFATPIGAVIRFATGFAAG